MSAISIPALTTIDINIEYSCKSVIDLLIKRIKLAQAREPEPAQ